VTPDQPPLWPDGWWVEPCRTAPPPAPARRLPQWMKPTVTVPVSIDQYPEGAET
jgi:hypothetical protein